MVDAVEEKIKVAVHERRCAGWARSSTLVTPPARPHGDIASAGVCLRVCCVLVVLTRVLAAQSTRRRILQRLRQAPLRVYYCSAVSPGA